MSAMFLLLMRLQSYYEVETTGECEERSVTDTS